MHSINFSSPLLVGIASTPTCLKRFSDPSSEPLLTQADLLELRLDALSRPSWSELPESLPPLLVTARDPREGGLGNLPLSKRLALLEDALPHAAALDLEWVNYPSAKPLLELARKQGVLRIASAHNFESTPDSNQLCRLVDQVADSPQRPDLLKISCRLQFPSDLARLLELLDAPPLPLALMGMGPLGPASRLILTAAGSRLLYGYLFETNAPGQQSLSELKKMEKLWRIHSL